MRLTARRAAVTVGYTKTLSLLLTYAVMRLFCNRTRNPPTTAGSILALSQVNKFALLVFVMRIMTLSSLLTDNKYTTTNLLGQHCFCTKC